MHDSQRGPVADLGPAALELPGPVAPAALPGPLVVVLDVANVMGSRPDGWWRDRPGAARRVVEGASRVLAGGGALAVVAVLEGRARTAEAPTADGLEVVLAPGEGDDTIVEVAGRSVRALTASARLLGPVTVVVVTADRGLRARLPAAARAAGPRWWFDLVETAGTSG